MITCGRLQKRERPPSRQTGPRSAIDSYFQEIDQTALLSAEQERELSQRVRKGDAAARDHMVRANLRLVVAIARKYSHPGLSFEDVIAEGNLGLLRAVEGFDPTRNTRFSTYARFWISQSIRRAMQTMGRTIRIPCYLHHTLSQWQKERTVLHERLGRAPTEEELRAQMRLSRRKYSVLRQAARISHSASLAEEKEGQSMEDALADKKARPPEDEMVRSEEAGSLKQLLNGLKQRDATMLRMRYGLDGEEPQTFEEIGERFGVTRERIRQIIRKSLRKLNQGLKAG